MNPQMVTVERKRLDSYNLYGVKVAQSDSLVLLHLVEDFLFDGFIVVRRKDISKIYTSESDDYAIELMKKEGLLEKVPRQVADLPLDSWGSLLRRFIGKVVILENERKEDDFNIGPVVAVGKTAVTINFLDPCGKIIGEVEVPFSKITCMRFGGRYSTIHAKYMEKR